VIKYQEPEVVDPRTLEPGDQVGFSTGGTGFMICTTEPSEDEVWATLVNEPAKTTEVPEYGWHRPVPHGNVALDLADYGWVWGVFPTVWARRMIR
jgi:hypothetical protein